MERLVEAELALVDQDHRRHAGDRLGHRIEAVDAVPARAARAGEAVDAAREDRRVGAPEPERDHHVGDLARGDVVLDQLGHVGPRGRGSPGRRRTPVAARPAPSAAAPPSHSAAGPGPAIVLGLASIVSSPRVRPAWCRAAAVNASLSRFGVRGKRLATLQCLTHIDTCSNLLDPSRAIVALVLAIPSTIPLLGWGNWFVLPLAAGRRGSRRVVEQDRRAQLLPDRVRDRGGAALAGRRDHLAIGQRQARGFGEQCG